MSTRIAAEPRARQRTVLVVALELVDRRAPAWLVACLAALEREGVVSVVTCESAHVPAAAREGLGSALDAWIARRVLPENERAWTPVPWSAPRANGTPALTLATADATAHGGEVWSLRCGASGTFFRAEHTRGDAVLEITLVAHTADGRTSTLAATRTKAAHSLALSRSRAGWKAAALLERVLRRRAAAEPRTSARVLTVDDSARTVRPARGPLVRTLQRAADRLTREDAWQLAWRRRAADDTLPGATPWRAEHVLAAPRGRFYADPFLLEHGGREALFFEEYVARAGRGHVAAVELGADGAPGPVRRVLDAPHHLSYPFVFEHEGAAYLIPETISVRRVELWRAREFPFEWERAGVLLDDVRAADATWCAHAGRFWLFACLARAHAPLSEELHVFWSERPFGPWRAHALNPIVDDPCSARPAGRPFVHAGRLVRPAQDVSREYGGRIVFQEVLELTPSRYAERTLGVLEPDVFARPGANGVHTYDRSARHEVCDMRRARWKNPIAWARRSA